MELSLIEPWALRHHGLITRAAATEAGMSRASWYRALASVRIEMVQPGVARLWGSPRTRQQRIAAAVLSIGRGAVASHRSAAFLWGVERPRGDPVDLVVARNQRVPDLIGVEVHRPIDRTDLVPAIRDGIAVTNPLRMLCDLATVDPGGIAAAVEQVVVAGLLLPPADDVLERAMAQLLVEHGLPPAEFRPIIEGFDVATETERRPDHAKRRSA